MRGRGKSRRTAEVSRDFVTQSASSLKKKGPRPVDARSSSAAAEANCSSPGSGGGGASPGVRAPTPGAVARATSTELGSETANSPAVSVAPRSPPSGFERCTSSSTDDSSPLPAPPQHPGDSGTALPSPAHAAAAAAAAPPAAASAATSNSGPGVEESQTAPGNGRSFDGATDDAAAGAPVVASAAATGSCGGQQSVASGLSATDAASCGEGERREETGVLSSPGCSTSKSK